MKTPKYLRKMILERQPALLEWTEEQLRVKDHVSEENIMPWLRAKTREQIIAHMEGYNTALEDMLRDAKCYAGYLTVGLPRTEGGCWKVRHGVRHGDPEFRDWARSYYTKA